MSIIFQLFSADDLKVLQPDKFEELTGAILGELRKSPSQVRQVLGVDRSPRLMIPQDTPQQLKDALRRRIHQVFQQLTSRPPRNPSRALEPARAIDEQLFEPDELAMLDAQKRLILQWAIHCEVAYLERSFEQYKALKDWKDRYHTEFSRIMNGQRPKGPDTNYSPFNPGSPLYRFYNP
jgi:hypothetical protein